MNMPHGRIARLVSLSPLLLASCAASLVYAQTPNPFQSLKDAVNKVVKQLPNQPQTQPGTQPDVQSGSTPSSRPAASPTAAVAPSGSAQVWTPPGETAAAVPFKGPLDAAKLPDIGGVHIGESSEQAVTALKKIH